MASSSDRKRKRCISGLNKVMIHLKSKGKRCNKSPEIDLREVGVSMESLLQQNNNRKSGIDTCTKSKLSSSNSSSSPSKRSKGSKPLSTNSRKAVTFGPPEAAEYIIGSLSRTLNPLPPLTAQAMFKIPSCCTEDVENQPVVRSDEVGLHCTKHRENMTRKRHLKWKVKSEMDLEHIKIIRKSDLQSTDAQREACILSIVAIMNRHLTEPSIQEEACMALSAFSTTNASIRVAIHDFGGIDAIKKAMDFHLNVASVQKSACAALQNYAYKNNNNKLTIGREGVSAIVTAMKQHLNTAGVQEKACGALSNLSQDDDSKDYIRFSGGMSMIHAAIVNHSTDMSVQKCARSALHQLCFPQKNLCVI